MRNVTIYFTPESVTRVKNSSTVKSLTLFKENIPLIYEKNEIVIDNNILTRLTNLKNKSNIETVLLLPHDKERYLKHVKNRDKLEKGFTRICFGYETEEDISNSLNKEKLGKLIRLINTYKNISMECLNLC